MTERRARTQPERVAESARRLLEAAIELIAENGYEGTSAAEISRRAGYSRTMVQARYGSKEALLDAVMRSEYEELIEAPSEPGTPGLDQVLGRIDTLRQLVAEDPRFVRALFVLSFEAVGRATALRPRMAGWLERLEAGLVDSLATGQRDGSVSPDIEPPPAAREIIAMGIGIAYRWTLMPDTVDFEAETGAWRRRVESSFGVTGA
jgi:AcrR family transcriptional regulator